MIRKKIAKVKRESIAGIKRGDCAFLCMAFRGNSPKMLF